MKMHFVLIAGMSWATPAACQPSAACLAAAQRFTAFIREEAKGTRHARQIDEAIARNGGANAASKAAAEKLSPDQCAFILSAPDSTVRAMAIATLPERNGQ